MAFLIPKNKRQDNKALEKALPDMPVFHFPFQSTRPVKDGCAAAFFFDSLYDCVRAGKRYGDTAADFDGRIADWNCEPNSFFTNPKQKKDALRSSINCRRLWIF